MTDERIVSPETNETEELIEKSLRPQIYSQQYIGQNKVKEEIVDLHSSSQKSGRALIMCCFTDHHGLGKTTMAMVIANEMAVNIKTTSGPAIEKPGDFDCDFE